MSEAQERVVALARLGMSRKRIAARTGLALNTVYHYVQLARRDGLADMPKVPAGRRAADRVYLSVDPGAYAALLAAARARDISVDTLATRLLLACAEDALIGAVLDDAVAEGRADG